MHSVESMLPDLTISAMFSPIGQFLLHFPQETLLPGFALSLNLGM
jgi:hypothetical protein